MFPLHSSQANAKMAAETVTDMKGNVVKMEVDYSDAVDKMLPECEKLVKVTVNTHIRHVAIIMKQKQRAEWRRAYFFSIL